jgi:anthranilate 1,2-dioxygenase small subunit
MIESATLALIDALQLEYLRALDRRDMPAWEACFSDTASYVCTTSESEEQGLPVALMLDDNRQRIADRVNYVTRVWAGTFEDYRTRHFVQRLTCAARHAWVFDVETQFMVSYTNARGRSQILVTGVYLDEVLIEAGSARYQAKKAVLDTSVTPRYLVYPI